MRALWLGLVIAALVGGCEQSWEPPTLVQGLRVLAVKAEPPELAAGEAGSLTVLAVDPDGRPIDVVWDTCLIPAPMSGGAFDTACITSTTPADFVALGSGATVPFTMPAHELTELGLPDATAGFYQAVRLVATAGDAVVPAAFRVRYSLGLVPPNQNPALEGVFIVPADAPDPVPPEQLVLLDEAAPPEVRVGDVVTLRATLGAGSAETYLVPDGDPREGKTKETTELLRVSWYATAGDFSTPTTGEERPDTEITFEKYTPTPAPEGTTVDLWIVVRDERGGIDWAHRAFVLR